MARIIDRRQTTDRGRDEDLVHGVCAMWGTYDERRGILPRLRGRTFGSASGTAHGPNEGPRSKGQAFLQRPPLSTHAAIGPRARCVTSKARFPP